MMQLTVLSKTFRNPDSCPFEGHLKPSIFTLVKHACWFGLIGIVFVLLVPAHGFAQENLEVSGGYVHATSDFGLDGYDLGAAWWLSPRASIALNYDSGYDTSRIGAFELTSIGEVSIKNHLQNFLVGPRIFFATKRIKKYKFDPFAEVQFGGSHLNTKIQQVGVPSLSASDSAFTWMLGGGGEYNLDSHWSARVNLDLLRTHFSDAGQSRLRFLVGVAYKFGSR